MPTNSTQRFSDRVDNYVKYRPHYPPELLELLQRELGLRPYHTIADVGSGTGILAELLLRNGNTVYGIEPNAEMRGAAEQLLHSYANFTSVNGTAEHSKLPDHGIDLITAGQAFHWFNRDAAKREFSRILAPHGRVAIVWNDRRTATTPFLQAYEQLLADFATDYREVNHKNIGEATMQEFFAPAGCRKAVFNNVQRFDFEGLQGRLLSSSYAPLEGQPQHAPMMENLRNIFSQYARENTVEFGYDTTVYYGTMQ